MASKVTKWIPPKIGKTGHPYWVERLIRETRFIQAMELRASFLVHGIAIRGQVEEAVARVAFGDNEIPIANYRRCFRQPLVRMAASLYVQRQIELMGITKEDIVEGYKEAMMLARKLDRPRDMVAALKELEKFAETEKTADIDYLDEETRSLLLDFDEARYEEVEVDEDGARALVYDAMEIDIDGPGRKPKDTSDAEAILAESIEEHGLVWEGDHALYDPEGES